MLKHFLRILLSLVHNINPAETEEFLIIFISKQFSWMKDKVKCLSEESFF